MQGSGSRSVSTLRQIHVLHVDDDPAFSEMTAEMLARESDRFQVSAETSPDDALDRLATEPIDCVVSDYDMPSMNGIEFLRRVREEHPDLPFILFTGKGTEKVASEAFSAGATDYFQKKTSTDQYTVLANRVETVFERHRAQKHRRRLSEAIETAREGIAVLEDDTGQFLYLNEAYADIFGYDAEELIGESWERLNTEEGVEYTNREVLPTVQDQGIWSGQTTGLRADGSTFPVDHVVAATDADERICIAQDLSERQARQQEFDQYRTLVDTLTDPVYVLDERGRFVYVNDAFLEMTGYEREELIGSGPVIIKDQQAVRQGERNLSRILSSEGPDSAHFEVEIRPKDGDPIPCEDHTGVLPYEGESFDGSVGILRDLSEQREQKRTVRRYRRLLESLNDPVYALDEDGHVTYVNDAWTETFGYDAEDILGDHISRIVPDEDVERSERVIAALLGSEDRETATWEITATTQGGEQLTVENGLTVLTDDTGTFEGSVVVAHDITDTKQEKERLKRQNERLDEFAGIISHDLHNPLNIVRSRLALLRDECDSDHIEPMERGVERMERLIDDVLRLARSGEVIDERESVRLADLVDGCWQTVPTHEATLTVETDQTITADRPRLRQLVENLLHNAVEHGGDEVTITVGDLPDGFYVADDGPGIPAEKRDEVFEYGHSTAEDGTGYGLAIVRAVAQAHGWTVTVTDSAGGGARFELTGIEQH